MRNSWKPISVWSTCASTSSNKNPSIEQRKEHTIQSRDNCVKVALVGYTNAGKSTVMNFLTSAEVLAQDRLFATLDTRTARMNVDYRNEVVLSDTVGFIRSRRTNSSPPSTPPCRGHRSRSVAARSGFFPSVMEEQIQAVEDVLAEIGAKTCPQSWCSTRRTNHTRKP